MLGTRPTAVLLDGDRRNITKTPGRALAKPRNALQENACRDVPMTVNAKGKRIVHNTPLPLKTLQTDRVLKNAPGKQTQVSKLRETPLIRPLGDKTPFPNRIANRVVPPLSGSKITNPTLLLDGSLRTSSTRKHDRLPRSASKTFETPVTSGNHWDVSDIDIEIGGVVANQSLEEEDYDEVEYMPPKVEDVSYEPPFELPNYREVGKTLMALIRSFPLEDNPPTVPSFSNEVLESKNDELSLPSIEGDDLFVGVKAEVKRSVKAPEAVPSLRKPQQKSEFRNLTITKTATCISRSTVPIPARKLSPIPTTHRLPPTGPNRPAHSTSRPPAACISSSARATRASSVLRSRSVAPSHTSTTSTRTTSLTLDKPSITRNTGTTKETVSGRTRPRFGSTSKPPPSSMSKPASRTGNGVRGTPKDLEGLIIFEDTWDIEEFRFDV